MATVETTPMPLIAEHVTYCLVNTTNDKNEEITQFMTEKAAQKLVEEKKGTIVASQTFATYNVGSLESGVIGPDGLFESEKEALKVLNRGIDQKSYQLIRAKMLEQDEEGTFTFTPKEGAWDLKKEIGAESASRATTPEAKLEKVLAGVDDATAAALLQKLMAKFQAQQ